MAFRLLRGVRNFSTGLLRPGVKNLPSVTLYKYKICPYCNEVKTLLDYLGLPYNQVEVDPLSKKELAFSPGYRKVPIMVMDGQQVNDSKAIMDGILQKLKENDHVEPESLKQLQEGVKGKEQVEEWAEFATKKLAVLMYPNMCASFSSAFNAFSYVHQVEGWSSVRRLLIQCVGTLAMRAGHSRLKKKYSLTDERKALLDTILLWTNQIGQQTFHGGSKPDMADVCVFGVVDAVRDMPLHDDLMANTNIGPWYEAMKKQIK